ncbi:MAG: hypothetical protein RIB98_13150 [Acidimicrobiales bacterium]
MVASRHRPTQPTDHATLVDERFVVVDLAPTGIEAIDSLVGTVVRLVERGVDSDLNSYIVVSSCVDGTQTMLYGGELEPLVANR